MARLRTHEGFFNLKVYDSIRTVRRAGHVLLIGEIAGQMTQHILCYFDPREDGLVPEARADILLDLVFAANPEHRIDARPHTNIVPDAVMADIINESEGKAPSPSQGDEKGPSSPPAGGAKEPRRTVTRIEADDPIMLTRGDAKAMIGKTIIDVQLAKGIVAIITE